MLPIDDSFWFVQADRIAESSDCVRRKVGAILLCDGHIVSSGFNSAPGPMNKCHECPRSMLPAMEASKVAGHGYDLTESLCYATHAEARALLNGYHYLWRSLIKGIMYVNSEPCHNCKILIAECRVEVRWVDNAGCVKSLSPKEGPGYGHGANPSEIPK